MYPTLIISRITSTCLQSHYHIHVTEYVTGIQEVLVYSVRDRPQHNTSSTDVKVGPKQPLMELSQILFFLSISPFVGLEVLWQKRIVSLFHFSRKFRFILVVKLNRGGKYTCCVRRKTTGSFKKKQQDLGCLHGHTRGKQQDM